MKQEALLKIFKDANALLTGHFLLSSGLHSEQYLQCAAVLSYPQQAHKLCTSLAEKFKRQKIDLVIGPAYGGILVAYELARVLGARAIFTEREDNRMQLRRDFTIAQGARVLVAEDVVTTGKSAREVIETIRPYQPEIIAVAALVDRSGGKNPFGAIAFEGLLKIDIKTYSPEHCPLCKRDIPLVKPGSRK